MLEGDSRDRPDVGKDPKKYRLRWRIKSAVPALAAS